MGLFDLISDVVDIASDVTKVVLTPAEIAAKGVREVTKVAADLAEDVKSSLTGDK
jgi:hypothetical protein